VELRVADRQRVAHPLVQIGADVIEQEVAPRDRIVVSHVERRVERRANCAPRRVRFLDGGKRRPQRGAAMQLGREERPHRVGEARAQLAEALDVAALAALKLQREHELAAEVLNLGRQGRQDTCHDNRSESPKC
jgi:hypothetical protein